MYPEKMVKEQMKRVVFGKTGETWKDSTKLVPFVVTFHPKLTFLGKKIKGLSKCLHIDLEVKAVFRPAPMVSFRSARKVKDYLVRTKLYPLVRNISLENVTKLYAKCVTILKVQISFSSTVTGETYKINHYFNCDGKCLVCLITCRTCKLQYTGQTCDAFQKRWNNCRCCAR